jgi:hypothetical protein
MGSKTTVTHHRKLRPSLAELIGKLSFKRQEIIRPVLENPRDFVLLSVWAMAKRLKSIP